MNCDYVRNYYGVPAEIGRRVSYRGKEGVIYRDGGNYIAVNFDHEKPGVITNIHPKDENLKYLEMGKLRKMTRSQARYRRYLAVSDCYENFMNFCYWDEIERKKSAIGR